MSIKSTALKARMDSFTPLEGMGAELNKTKNLLKAIYDFDVQGGLQGDIALVDEYGKPAALPLSAIVTRVIVDTIDAPTSAGLATIALKSEGAGDILGATAIAGFTGVISGEPDGTVAKMVKMTAERIVTATVAVDDLTAGKIIAFVEYVLSE